VGDHSATGFDLAVDGLQTELKSQKPGFTALVSKETGKNTYSTHHDKESKMMRHLLGTI